MSDLKSSYATVALKDVKKEEEIREEIDGEEGEEDIEL